MKKKSLYITAALSLLLLLALFFWKKGEILPPPSPPEFELKEISFKNLPDWKKDNIEEARGAFKDSCEKILLEKKEFLSNAMSRIPAAAYREICREFAAGVKDFRMFVETRFTPYLVLAGGSDTGKFTSYYESTLNASYAKDDIYKYPVYGKPADLVEFNPKDFDDSLPSKRLTGRLKGQKLVPYHTRREIDEKGLDAPVILWGDDPVDIYIMQIQGSAIATLPDGSAIRIGYADNNGHPFRGIGSILLEKGLLQPGKSSMPDIRDWLRNNKETAIGHMNENKRFIFHRILSGEGPVGAHGVPLHPGRSLAVDTKYIPLGALLWLETTLPGDGDIRKLMVAQDVGGAIKGGIRGDYFWGSGEEILEKAGRMNARGRYFLLKPKTTEKGRE